MAHDLAPVDPSALAERLDSLGISIPSDQLPELIPTIVQTFGGHHSGHLHLPPAERVNDFETPMHINLVCIDRAFSSASSPAWVG